MKIGVNLLLWTGGFADKDVSLFETVSSLGYDGVEIPVFSTKGIAGSTVRKALSDTGLGCTICSVMAPDASLIDPDADARQRGVDFLRSVVELAADLGAEVICGPIYSPVGRLVGRGRTTDEWSWCVDALAQVAPDAESAGVRLAVEPLNRFETYFLNVASDALRLAADVGSPAIGVHFDTFHANIEEKDPVGAVRACGDRIYHFHCSENDRGPVGTGHVDWEGMASALREIEYDRWLVVESFLPAIKEIAAAASIWRELSPSPETLATDSLVFLRRLVA
jgi:D-psicose/D-tagatose/L-ribulose 3-epimerase